MFRFTVTLVAAVPFAVFAADERELPPAEKRMKAAATVADVYGADAAKAKTRLDKTKLAARVREAAGSEKDSASRWAMLDFARDIAAQAGDAQQVNGIIAELKTDFGHAAQAFTISGETLIKSGRATNDIVDLLLICVDAAIDTNEFATARRIAEGAIPIANKVRDTTAAKYFEFAQKRAAELRKKFAAVKDNPDALARFHFFDKQDIRVGIPLLAKVKDTKLAEAAQKDIDSEILTGNEMAAVGDRWGQLADSGSPEEKIPFLLAAVAAYARAVPNQTGLEKAKSENRIKQIVETIDAEEAKNGLFLTFTGTWVYEGTDAQKEEFTIHRSGRILMEVPNGRWYLTRQGKKVVLQQPEAISRWTVIGDSLTIELMTLNGKPTSTIDATRKQ